MKRNLNAMAIAVALCALAVALPQSGTNAAAGKVKADALVPQGMPFSVAADVTTYDGRGMSELQISVSNESNEDVDAVRLAVFIKRPSGQIKAGEGWKEGVRIPAHSAKTFSVALRGTALYGDRAVVILQGAAGQSGRWEVGLDDVFAAVPVRGKKDSLLPPSRYVGRAAHGGAFVSVGAAPQGTYCKDALNNAKSACNAGLDSFSCDEKNQTFSFTCKGVAPLQP